MSTPCRITRLGNCHRFCYQFTFSSLSFLSQIFHRSFIKIYLSSSSLWSRNLSQGCTSLLLVCFYILSQVQFFSPESNLKSFHRFISPYYTGPFLSPHFYHHSVGSLFRFSLGSFSLFPFSSLVSFSTRSFWSFFHRPLDCALFEIWICTTIPVYIFADLLLSHFSLSQIFFIHLSVVVLAFESLCSSCKHLTVI